MNGDAVSPKTHDRLIAAMADTFGPMLISSPNDVQAITEYRRAIAERMLAVVLDDPDHDHRERQGAVSPVACSGGRGLHLLARRRPVASSEPRERNEQRMSEPTVWTLTCAQAGCDRNATHVVVQSHDLAMLFRQGAATLCWRHCRQMREFGGVSLPLADFAATAAVSPENGEPDA